MKNTKRVEILNKYNYKFKNHPKFDEEFDNLKGKCSSLEEDFMKFKKALLINLETNNHRLTHRRYILLKNFKGKDTSPVFKVKEFRCKSQRNGRNSPFRIIFILNRKKKTILFTEFYYKKNQKTDFNSNRVWEVFDNQEYYF